MLGNLGVRDGGQVTVAARAAARRPAGSSLAGPAEIVAAVSPGDAPAGAARQGGHHRRRRLAAAAGRAAGRRAAQLVEAARRSLSTRVGYGLDQHAAHRDRRPSRTGRRWSPWTPWSAGRTARPPPAARPRRRHAPAAGRPAAPTGPEDEPLADHRRPARPAGRRPRQLTELLDLGFHHREVLARLGTTVALGVLVTGPAGSGKSALVRAVAGRGRRPGRPALGARRSPR